MAGATFEQVAGFTYIYQLQTTPGDGALATVYFILPPTSPNSPLAQKLDLDETWGEVGSYVFTSAPFDGDLEAIASHVNDQLAYNFDEDDDDDPPPHAFVWADRPPPALNSPPDWPSSWKWIGFSWGGSAYLVKTPVDLFWGQLGLHLLGDFFFGLTVALDGNNGFVISCTASDGANITLSGKSIINTSAWLPHSKPWNIRVPLAGSTTGSMDFIIGIDYKYLISSFGLGFIYAYGGADQALYYPAFPRPRTGPLTPVVSLQIYLHPLFPFEAKATRFIQLPPLSSPNDPGNIDYPGGTKALDILPAPYYFTTDGRPLALDRFEQDGELDPGFAFSLVPPGVLANSATTGESYYLSPVGFYQVPATSPPSDVDLMPGLSGLEYLRLQSGDLIEFVNNQPAYAAGFGTVASPPATTPSAVRPLIATYTTSWVRIPPPSPGPVRAYFGQPSSSTYFGHGEVGSPAKYPEAVQSQLWEFGPLSPEPNPVAFPFVPYGAIYLQHGEVAPNAPPPAGDAVGAGEVMKFEAAVLANERHSVLATSDTGPIFMPAGAAAPSSSLVAALTPQGLVVELNADGTWDTVTLAVTPDPTSLDPPLQIDPKPDLANVLTRDQLFLVLSNPDRASFGNFKNLIKIAGFEFLLDVIAEPGDGSPDSIGTILVFKFNNQIALRDLVKEPSLWAEPATFACDPNAVSAQLSTLINLAFDTVVSPQIPDAFFDFRSLAGEPAWTGVIAFNVQIDGNQMASDFQMLLGGIEIDLRAHHIGIETNLIDTGSPKPAIQHSSLFGVIYYSRPESRGDHAAWMPGVLPRWSAQGSRPPPGGVADDLNYEVEKLIVVFKNSVVSVFEATVSLTVDAIFGRAAARTADHALVGSPPDNRITIQGQYQVHGGVGTVVFYTTQGFDFTFPVPPSSNFPRALERLQISQARLVPISGGPTSASPPAALAGSPAPTTIVQCAFCLEGELWFDPNPFPGTDAVDLFSYGDETGLAFTNLNAGITFTLTAQGSRAGPPSIAVNYSEFLPAPAGNAIRSGSLLGSLPARFSRFVSGPDLQTAAAASQPVHCAQLAVTANGALAPLATHTPQFALEYDVSLGSLGSLSDGQAVEAKLLLGWGPSAFHAEKDAGGILVQLPQLSAGIAGIDIEGVLQVQLGVGNLVKVNLGGQSAYAILFNNAQLSVLGLTFPPGVMADFILFAGQSPPDNKSNIAWFLAAEQP